MNSTYYRALTRMDRPRLWSIMQARDVINSALRRTGHPIALCLCSNTGDDLILDVNANEGAFDAKINIESSRGLSMIYTISDWSLQGVDPFCHCCSSTISTRISSEDTGVQQPSRLLFDVLSELLDSDMLQTFLRANAASISGCLATCYGYDEEFPRGGFITGVFEMGDSMRASRALVYRRYRDEVIQVSPVRRKTLLVPAWFPTFFSRSTTKLLQQGLHLELLPPEALFIRVPEPYADIQFDYSV